MWEWFDELEDDNECNLVLKVITDVKFEIHMTIKKFLMFST